MKKKLLAVMVIGVMAFVMTACRGKVTSQDTAAASESDEMVGQEFVGSWTEENSGRCIVDITPVGNNGEFTIQVHWGSSAYESVNWDMTATYNAEDRTLDYQGATAYTRTYSDEENYTDTVMYEDGTGSFRFDNEGYMHWTSDQQDVDGVTPDMNLVSAGQE